MLFRVVARVVPTCAYLSAGREQVGSEGKEECMAVVGRVCMAVCGRVHEDRQEVVGMAWCFCSG